MYYGAIGPYETMACPLAPCRLLSLPNDVDILSGAYQRTNRVHQKQELAVCVCICVVPAISFPPALQVSTPVHPTVVIKTLPPSNGGLILHKFRHWDFCRRYIHIYKPTRKPKPPLTEGITLPVWYGFPLYAESHN